MSNPTLYQIQAWEQRLLYYDTSALWELSTESVVELAQHRKRFVMSILDDWFKVDALQSEFDVHSYNEYVKGLEKMLFLAGSGHVTRERIGKFRSRALDLKLCSIDEEGRVRLNPTFYFDEIWDRDIDGWVALEKESIDPTIKSWFRCFKERAVRYKRDHAKHVLGGECVQYDFAAGYDGPFVK
jgi:hypothetical protein